MREVEDQSDIDVQRFMKLWILMDIIFIPLFILWRLT